MKIVGLTGGIGSGKTTISKMFRNLGVPIYIADTEAKSLMNHSKILRMQIIEKFGERAYNEEGLDRDFIAAKVFSDKADLEILNSIVHPMVASHFSNWLNKQDFPYVIKEAAIIFENKMESQYDFIITVVGNKDERIKRIIKRDSTTEKRILSIMENQFSDEEKIAKSDYVIINNNLQDAQKSVLKIHNLLLELCIK